MLFGPTLVKALLCLFVCMCNGAPPKEDRQSPSCWYTEEEDRFIIKEITRLLDNKEPINTKEAWDKITEHHKDMWEKNAPGFPQDRTTGSLRYRFYVLKCNGPQLKVKIPDTLLQKINAQKPAKLKTGLRDQPRFSTEEMDFIVKELLKPSCKNMLTASTARKILVEHDKKRLAKTKGFEKPRSVNGIRSLMYRVNRNGQFPSQVKEKFPTVQKEPRDTHRFTIPEDEFIAQELLKSSCTDMLSAYTAKKIFAEHEKKCLAKKKGFENERTFDSIRSHLYKLYHKGPLPSQVRAKFPTDFHGASTSGADQDDEILLPEMMDELDEDDESDYEDDDEWAEKTIQELKDKGFGGF